MNLTSPQEEFVDIKIPFYALLRMPKSELSSEVISALWNSAEPRLHSELGLPIFEGIQSLGLQVRDIGMEDADYWEVHVVEPCEPLPF